MSSAVMTLHPEPERLLRYVDAELAGRERDEVRAHLSECVECQAWLGEIESGANEYRRQILPAWKDAAAPPPEAWFDLRERLAAIDRPAVRMMPARSYPRWIAAAAAVLVAVVTTHWLTEETVSAAELLRDASARERSSAAQSAGKRVRVTSRKARNGTEALRVRFETANYSWDNPLSARSFAAWRDRLPEKEDEVSKLREGEATFYEISTRTAHGNLAEARLRLRTSDLHATRGEFRFRDDEVVEITEAEGAAPEPSKAPGISAPPAPSRLPSVIEEPVTPGEELRVWVALRRVGADLGEPIEVERNAGANLIQVTALGLNPARRQALEQALGALPRVQVRFQDPQAVREPSRRLQGSAAPRLESELGGASAEEFVDRVLRASESALARAHALRILSRRFPVEVEATLAPSDRVLLRSLLGEHFDALHASARAVLTDGRQLQPSVAPVPSLAAQSWQAHAQSLVEAVEAADQLLTRVLATAAAGDSTKAELDQALSRLEGELTSAGAVLPGRP